MVIVPFQFNLSHNCFSIFLVLIQVVKMSFSRDGIADTEGKILKTISAIYQEMTHQDLVNLNDHKVVNSCACSYVSW